MGTSLYERLLGDDFQVLPESLRSFHRHPTTRKGTLLVTRPRGRFRNFIADRMKLPPAGQAKICVDVQVEGDKEIWRRDFDGYALVTSQWQAGPLMIEEAGPMRFGLEVRQVGKGMTFRQKRAWFARVPLPPFAAPRVWADVVGEGDGWRVEVRVSVPILGQLVQYAGKIEGV